MVQRSRSRWEIVSAKGFVMQANIAVSSRLEAEEYVKRYVSSFLNWDYIVSPLKDKK